MSFKSFSKLLFQTILFSYLLFQINCEKIDSSRLKDVPLKQSSSPIKIKKQFHFLLTQQPQQDRNLMEPGQNSGFGYAQRIRSDSEVLSRQMRPQRDLKRKIDEDLKIIPQPQQSIRLLFLDINCATQDPLDSNKCQTCNSGYTVNSQGTCSQCGSNCKKCTYNSQTQLTQCTQCRPVTPDFNKLIFPYILLNNICYTQFQYNDYIMIQISLYDLKFIKCPGYCETCILINGNFQCDYLKGSMGFSMLDTFNLFPCKGLCNGCITQTVPSDMFCYECTSTYYKQANMCYSCQKESFGSCSKCTVATKLSCTKCVTNYFLQSDSCIACNENCDTCSSHNICTKCNAGYSLVQIALSEVVCVVCPENCLNCISQAESFLCTQCFMGYFLDSLSNCVPCSANCKTCTSPSVCTACLTGYVILSTSPQCFKQIDNCQHFYKDSGVCRQCALGYEKVNQQCKVSLTPIDNKFFACAQNQYHKNFRCYDVQTPLEHCIQYNELYCTKCENGYFIDYVENTFIQVCSRCQVEGCVECRNQGMCRKCEDGYFLDHFVKQYQCIKCVENCKTCVQKASYCLTCQEDFYLTASMNCISYKQFKFYFEFEYSYNIISEVLNSLKASFQSIAYPSEYSLSDTLKKRYCQITQIKPGVINPAAYTLIQGYISYPDHSIIEKIYLNFTDTLKTNNVLNNIPIKRASFSSIRYCPVQYFLNCTTQMCEPFVIANCKIYDSQNYNLSCKQCTTGLTPKVFDTVCSLDCSSLPDCEACVNLGSCYYCKTGFILIKGNCKKIIDNCQQYNDETAKCLSCNSTNLRVSNDGSFCQNIIQNCIIYTFDGNCSRCLLGFNVTSDGKTCAEFKIDNCLTYSTDYKCTQCNSDSLRISNDGSACQPIIQNCEKYTDSGLCSVCNSINLHISTDGLSCQNVIQNCQTYNPNGTCSSCNSPNLRASNSKQSCQPVIDKCLSYKDNGSCIQCDPVYIVFNNGLECVIKPIDCLTYTDDMKCASCKQNYRISNDKMSCQKIILNCFTYADDGKCITCNQNTDLSNTSLSCQNKIQNCVSYGDDGKCLQCSSDVFRISNTGFQCQRAIKDCVQYNELGKCIQCRYQELRVSKEGTQCQSKIQNCKTYTYEGFCFQCNDNYRFSNNHSLCQLTIQKCIAYTDDGKCTQCISNYHPANDQMSCQISVQNCQTYFDGGKCRVCSTNYRISNNGLTCQAIIDKCQSYKDNGKCQICMTDYRVSTNESACQLILPNCIQYKSDGKCQKCEIYYLLTPNGTCETVTCDATKRLSNDKLSCQPIVQNCTLYSDKGKCLKCTSFNGTTYKIINNQCMYVSYDLVGQVYYGSLVIECMEGCNKCYQPYSCQQCKAQGYYKSNINTVYNICLKCLANCANCSDQTSCTSCFDGFAFDSITKTCKKCSDNLCLTCSSSNLANCTKCMDLHFLSNGKCTSCFEGCKNCSTNTTCSQCDSGYLLVTTTSQNQCTRCSQGCAKCSKTSCLQCYPGYFNSSGTCTKCKQNCWSCTSSTDCLECAFGLKLYQKECLTYIDHCRVYNKQTNGCIQCYFGYKLNSKNDSCIVNESQSNESEPIYPCNLNNSIESGQNCTKCSITIENCLKCKENICLKCNDGYFVSKYEINATNSCQKCSLDGCKKCKTDKICSECSEGYYMSLIFQNYQVMKAGNCTKCNQNCRTCYYKSTYCTSCNEGYNLTSSLICAATNQISISMTLNIDIEAIFEKLNEIIEILAETIPSSSSLRTLQQKKKAIQIKSIKKGSVIIQSYIALASKSDLTQAESNVNTAIAPGKPLAGIDVQRVQIVNPIKSEPSSKAPCVQNCSGSSSIAIIAGAAAGGGVLLIVGIIIFCICRKRCYISEDQKIKTDSTSVKEQDRNQVGNGQTSSNFIITSLDMNSPDRKKRKNGNFDDDLNENGILQGSSQQSDEPKPHWIDPNMKL